MVIEANIDGWAVSKILVDEGSSVDIIFTSTIDAIKIDRKMLGRASTHCMARWEKDPLNWKNNFASFFWNSKQCKNRANLI